MEELDSIFSHQFSKTLVQQNISTEKKYTLNFFTVILVSRKFTRSRSKHVLLQILRKTEEQKLLGNNAGEPTGNVFHEPREFSLHR